MSPSSGTRPAVQRRHAWPLRVFLVVAVSLIVLSELVPSPAGDLVRIAVIASAPVIMTVTLAVRRPRPMLGWALIGGSQWVILALTILLGLQYGSRGPGITIDSTPATVLTALVYPPLAAGLALLSRRTPRRGPADILDAAMTALAAFLLLWTLVLDPIVQNDVGRMIGSAVFPIGLLLVFAIAVKLLLGGGFRDPSLALLLLGVTALLGAAGFTFVPALRTATLVAGILVSVLALTSNVLITASVLHPAAARDADRPRETSTDASPRRMALFAVLALVTPLAWTAEASRRGDRFGNQSLAVGIAVVTAAVFLLLLVARLGLIARVAQRQARQLTRDSLALTEAVSEQKQLQRELAYRALHDPLTGLPNRLVLAERMQRALQNGTGQHILLLLDLDGFKDINDTLGHQTGDELLVAISHRMRDATPPGTTLARLGGDEFAAFVEDSGPSDGQRLAELFLDALRRPYLIGGRELFLSTSIGLYATEPDRPATPSEALRDADLALYAAKEAGKNRVVAFYPALRAARQDHTRISAGLRRALAADELLLNYEPVVNLGTRKVVAVEALLRWQPVDGPLVLPADFIPIAEDTGLILPIGAWVLRQACRDARPWYEQHDVAVSVNVSGRQLDDPAFADTAIASLTAAGLPGRALIIEITESNLVDTSPARDFHAQLRRLRAHGIRIAIDDFGTGYSSLSSIARLPVDIVKIDKSFTQAHGGSNFAPGDWAFTKGILQLVDSLHMIAIAEGVETAEQERELRALNCPLAQGYYFSRPVPASVIDNSLATGRSPAHVVG